MDYNFSQISCPANTWIQVVYGVSGNLCQRSGESPHLDTYITPCSPSGRILRAGRAIGRGNAYFGQLLDV